MGIKHFFGKFKKDNPNAFSTVKLNKNTRLPAPIDTLALDLNALIHPTAQKIYRYGNYSSLIKTHVSCNRVNNVRVFDAVCKSIADMVDAVKPRKRLIIAIDGVAGYSKMNQQRGRRFKSVQGSSEPKRDSFTPNSISPGTLFMDNLVRHLENYISVSVHTIWKTLDVVFSSDKDPGEGEHKIIHIARTTPDNSLCVVSPDADLIMLGLVSGIKDFYILREDMNDPTRYFFVSVKEFRYSVEKFFHTVEDFIVVCCLLGNDFIPQIPGIEVHNGGIENLMEAYKETLVDIKTKLLNRQNLHRFLKRLQPLCLTALKKKYLGRSKYFQDSLVEKYFSGLTLETVRCEYDCFKTQYYKKAQKVTGETREKLSEEYIKGIQFVVLYYTRGIPDWTWYYANPYAPFVDELSECSSIISFRKNTKPAPPFLQLLCILPPQNVRLLPLQMRNVVADKKSYFPTTIDIDYSGKYSDWEGIPILPPIPVKLFTQEYDLLKKKHKDIGAWSRDRIEPCYLYKQGTRSVYTL